MNRIRQGDMVVVIAGKSRGERGAVRRIILGADGRPARVVVEGINRVTKHVRPNPQKNDPGGRVGKDAPLHISNVMLYDSEKGRGCRVRIGQNDNGKKTRMFVGGGEVK